MGVAAVIGERGPERGLGGWVWLQNTDGNTRCSTVR